jgi:cytochrome c1
VAGAPAEDSAANGASAAEYGKQLILAKGCGGCHTIPGLAGATGEFGPDLGGVGARPRVANGAVPHAGPADLERWILDPSALKPGTQMPRLGLTRPEAAAIVSFLETLR